MCGIAGVVNRGKSVEPSALKRMGRALAHRGPDGESLWINDEKNVGFGFRRLAILDLSAAGSQPMQYADERYTMVFNGEIYNFVEIRERLEKKGFHFKSRTDTEVLLALFHEKREACLEDLDGMFAFAVWDAQKRRLFCARDRFGEKPFYFALRDGAFYFASEMKALWAAGVPRRVSEKMLFNYLTNNFLYNPQDLTETFYEEIYKLKAAHYFFITPDRLQIEQIRYWNIDYEKINHDISEPEAISEFRALFERSIKRRLRSDVPVGSSLSGGLDSSLIVCVIDALSAEKPTGQAAFSARFPNFAKDEGRFMQAVIRRANVEPHFVYPDDKGLAENLERLFYHQEEPFGSASIYAQFCVMRLAKENDVTVLLDGQGADEILAGYPFYFEDYFRELKARNKDLWRRETQVFRKIYGENRNGDFNLKKNVAALLPFSLKDRARRIRHRRRQISGSFLDRRFQKEFLRTAFPPPEAADTLQKSLYKSAFCGSLEELLRYSDRNSMAHSREVRLPFLSHRLAEFLFSLPPHFKIRNGTTKYIMRAAFREVLPPEIAARTDKIGYEPPQKSWLENPRLIEKIEGAAEALSARKILNQNALDFARSRESKTAVFDSYNWKILMAASLFET